MKKTYVELQNICLRKTKTNDPDSIDGFKEDLNIGLGIVKSLINPEYTIDTLSLLDGQETYPLAADVERIEQIRITSPTTYKKVIPPMSKEKMREINPVASNDSEGTPNYWYFVEPTIASNGIRTLNINFYPIPDRSYTATYSYSANPPVMTVDNDYPFFDEKFHHILPDYAIWQYAEREADPTMNPNYWRNKWDEEVEQFRVYSINEKNKHPLPIPGVSSNIE